TKTEKGTWRTRLGREMPFCAKARPPPLGCGRLGASTRESVRTSFSIARLRGSRLPAWPGAPVLRGAKLFNISVRMVETHRGGDHAQAQARFRRGAGTFRHRLGWRPPHALPFPPAGLFPRP